MAQARHSNTLKWVRERSVKEGRPVCHNGRFEPVEGGELSNWKRIDFKDWQKEPDGTIFLIDECHNDMPVRGASATVPDEIRMLAEHRRRGMDFYLVTQHPQNIDNFVRRMVGSPGWHRHLKRTFGADLVSCIEWAAVNPNCEKDGSGKTGTVSMVGFPKEVYGWYKSASLHTGEKENPARCLDGSGCRDPGADDDLFRCQRRLQECGPRARPSLWPRRVRRKHQDEQEMRAAC